MGDANFWAIFFEATEKTQTPFLRRAIDNDRITSKFEDEDEARVLIGDLIFAATTKDDRTLEKNIVINFLNDLQDSLNNNETIGDLRVDYQRNLQFHSQQGRYYYRDRNETIYSDNPAFRARVIDSKTGQLNVAGTIDPIDEIRLKVIVQ